MRTTFFLAIALLFAPSIGAPIAAADSVYVQINEGRLREKPQHWARAVADLHYGDTLETLSADAGWLRVRNASGVEGFVHESAVTQRRVVLTAGAATAPVQIAESDVVLAGKGFSGEVEESFARGDSGLDYAAVDALAKRSVSDERVAQFIKDGGLGRTESAS
jgi:hypothetical protein